jgi:hypothetical protein
MEGRTVGTATTTWEAGELRKKLPATADAPGLAREALSVVGAGMPEDMLQAGRLLVSELVTSGVGRGAFVDLFIGVGRDQLRVEVSDDSLHAIGSPSASEDRGYGLTLVATLATRWGGGRENDRNVTWFEIALPHPGA